MASLKSELKTLYHVASAAALAAQSTIAEIERIEAENRTAAKLSEPAAEPAKVEAAPKPAAAPVPVEVVEAVVRELAGFTITPPKKKGQRTSLPSKKKGQRTSLPSKGEIVRKAKELGVTPDEIAGFFPVGVKPSNGMKLQILEHLDSLSGTKAAPATPPPPAEKPNGVRTLAGFEIKTIKKKGERMGLPSKGEITKKALALGMAQEKIAAFFPAGAKPSNEMKLKILEQLDGMSA